MMKRAVAKLRKDVVRHLMEFEDTVRAISDTLGAGDRATTSGNAHSLVERELSNACDLADKDLWLLLTQNQAEAEEFLARATATKDLMCSQGIEPTGGFDSWKKKTLETTETFVNCHRALALQYNLQLIPVPASGTRPELEQLPKATCTVYQPLVRFRQTLTTATATVPAARPTGPTSAAGAASSTPATNKRPLPAAAAAAVGGGTASSTPATNKRPRPVAATAAAAAAAASSTPSTNRHGSTKLDASSLRNELFGN